KMMAVQASHMRKKSFGSLGITTQSSLSGVFLYGHELFANCLDRYGNVFHGHGRSFWRGFSASP
ncbi:hypothetical protein ACJX0J_030736, partial [Zea mays]